jgi:tRNA threonylcarbamoyladenosine biosynthesis protein TsaE
MEHFEIPDQDFDLLNDVASRIIGLIRHPRVITFQGEMGAGKTTLIKAICKNLGIALPVSSPTFTLINEYMLPSGDPVYHIDMYRLEQESDAIQLGIADYTYSGNWCLIEWPEKIGNWLPENFVSLKIEVEAGTLKRIITMRVS